jgi:hypothetical protein
VRFNPHFVFDKGIAKTYDRNVFWDPARKTLAMSYRSADSEITEGPVEIRG